jgi:hypothetical protein
MKKVRVYIPKKLRTDQSREKMVCGVAGATANLACLLLFSLLLKASLT